MFGTPALTIIFVGATTLGVKIAVLQYKYRPLLNNFSIFFVI